MIERVNRIVNPDLQGIILARRVGSPAQLEELQNLREYQLTLRNTSRIHLQDVEIQFEFPALEIQALVSRPALSKTALIVIDASPLDPDEPWKKAIRWRIPHLPSGDSVEFTFRAVNPTSENYEVALYRTDRIILKRVVGEPGPTRRLDSDSIVWLVTIGTALAMVAFFVWTYFSSKATTKQFEADLKQAEYKSKSDFDSNTFYVIQEGCMLIIRHDRQLVRNYLSYLSHVCYD